MTGLIRITVSLYGMLLHLFPGEFQAEFREEMQGVFSTLVSNSIKNGIFSYARVCFFELLDFPINLMVAYSTGFQKEMLMMVANIRKPRWFFYPAWGIANAIVPPIAWVITETLLNLIFKAVGGTIQVAGQTRVTFDALALHVFFPIAGLLTGLVQVTLLPRYLPGLRGWIPATLLGWVSAFYVVGVLIVYPLFTAIPGSQTDIGPFWLFIGFMLVGGSMGLPQWWLLRKRVSHAAWWVLAHGFAWGMFGLLASLSKEPSFALLEVALLPPIATGVACWLLLDWFPRHELAALHSQ